MTVLVVLSGPRSSEQQARTALAAQGIHAEDHGHEHGLPDHPSGEDIREPQSFLTVHHDTPDDAVAVIAPLGWRLRMHFTAPEDPAPTDGGLLERVAELERQLATLAGRPQ